jgi:hypothetical protein
MHCAAASALSGRGSGLGGVGEADRGRQIVPVPAELPAESYFHTKVARTLRRHECAWLVAVCYAIKSVWITHFPCSVAPSAHRIGSDVPRMVAATWSCGFLTKHDVDHMYSWLNRVMGVLKNVLEALHRYNIAFREGLFVVCPELLKALDSTYPQDLQVLNVVN